MREIVPIIIAAILLIALAFYLSPKTTPEKKLKYTLLDENLHVLAHTASIPQVYGNKVLIGKTEKGYVYVPREDTFIPEFLDRFSFYTGKTKDVSIPVEWWMEYRGTKIIPVGNLAYEGYDIVTKTPYEIVRARSGPITIYQPVFLGLERKVEGNCVLFKTWNNLRVPVLLANQDNVVDPDYEKECMDCANWITINVFDKNNTPLRGYYSVGDGTHYFYFGAFDGRIRVCRCSKLKIYVSGYKPFSKTVCSDQNVILDPLNDFITLQEGYVYLDTTGALVSFGERFYVPPGAYKKFVRFPLTEVETSLPLVELPSPGWLGYQQRTHVPAYSFVRIGEKYYYTVLNDIIEVNSGLLCRDDVCLREGNVPLVSFGLCNEVWDGVLKTDCPYLGINPYK